MDCGGLREDPQPPEQLKSIIKSAKASLGNRMHTDNLSDGTNRHTEL